MPRERAAWRQVRDGRREVTGIRGRRESLQRTCAREEACSISFVFTCRIQRLAKQQESIRVETGTLRSSETKVGESVGPTPTRFRLEAHSDTTDADNVRKLEENPWFSSKVLSHHAYDGFVVRSASAAWPDKHKE